MYVCVLQPEKQEDVTVTGKDRWRQKLLSAMSPDKLVTPLPPNSSSSSLLPLSTCYLLHPKTFTLTFYFPPPFSYILPLTLAADSYFLHPFNHFLLPPPSSLLLPSTSYLQPYLLTFNSYFLPPFFILPLTHT